MNVDEDSTWVKGIAGEDCDCGATVEYPCYPGYSNVVEIIDVGEGVDRNLIGKRIMTALPHVKYATMDAKSSYEIIADGVDCDNAVFGTIATITMGSVRASKIRAGETVVVFGAGLIGQLVARQAQIVGAYNVIVADLSDERLALLPKDNTFIPVNTRKQDIREVIRKCNGGKLADVVFHKIPFGMVDYPKLLYHILLKKSILTYQKRSKISINQNI